jgi:hypothetical protein
MKTMVQDEYGSTDVLKLTDIAKPERGTNEVMVGVLRLVWAEVSAAFSGFRNTR